MITTDNMFERLPVSGNLFYVNVKGDIKDSNGTILEKYKDENGVNVVDLYWIDGYKPYEVSRLILATFRPLNIPVQSWKEVKVEYRDCNHDNLDFKNIGWLFPLKGIESKRYPGYFFIPGFTRYVINLQGSVIRTTTGKKLSGHVNSSGYIYFSLTADLRNGRAPSMGRHRLLALTFLNNGFSVEKLDVNHKNGIPGNDSLINLEWASRKENMLHAYSLGLRKDNKRVLVTNVKTGERKIYFSAHECERQLGLGRSKVHYRIKFCKGRVYPPGLTFEYLSGSLNIKKDVVPVKLYNTETNEAFVFTSMKKCSEAIGVSKKVIQKRLNKSNPAFFKHYKFEKIKPSV